MTKEDLLSSRVDYLPNSVNAKYYNINCINLLGNILEDLVE